jgi:hypothetical protein
MQTLILIDCSSLNNVALTLETMQGEESELVAREFAFAPCVSGEPKDANK